MGEKVGASSSLTHAENVKHAKNEHEMYRKKAVATDGFFQTSSYSGCSNIMPENLPLYSSAPLLCSGITVYSPMRRYGLDKPGIQVGIVGFGGLGHLAIRFARDFGANATVISSSLKKKEEAFDKFGVHSFLVSNPSEEMDAANGTLDAILDTLLMVHPLDPLFSLLKPLGKLVIVGVLETPFEVPAPSLLQGEKILAGSATGSVKETQEMMEFAAKHNIVVDVEVIPIDYVNTAMDRIEKSDVKYCFVILIVNTLKSS
ncbi:hypothetical protein M9H77_16745 [Catharanthus roseus]|uniref:Uncharacterized protein n=1 Tax=Catharanthus roseus TaxID=4058 RepID=A0ACC0B2T7_CATRO|nr:hypothetical protein M9H77_16745 [Catharanthus roseus]